MKLLNKDFPLESFKLQARPHINLLETAVQDAERSKGKPVNWKKLQPSIDFAKRFYEHVKKVNPEDIKRLRSDFRAGNISREFYEKNVFIAAVGELHIKTLLSRIEALRKAESN